MKTNIDMNEQSGHEPRIIRREIHPAITVPGKENGGEVSGAVIDFVSSDESVDRFGEIIVASGWRLENYRRNPIVQNSHNYGDILFTIGRALITEVRGRTLFQRIEFAVDINPVSRIAFGLYKGGFLNAVSVGFHPIRWENGKQDSGFVRKYLDQELIEVSAVGIPANPNALQMALVEGAVKKGDLQALLEHLEQLLPRNAGFSRSGRECIADFHAGSRFEHTQAQAGLETRDTADSEVCVTHAENDFGFHTADPGDEPGARGAGIQGAQWKQLTQLINEIRAALRRA